MTTTPNDRFSEQDRAALELMLEEPEAVELHGTDLTWQKALGQATNPARARPSLKDAILSASEQAGPPADAPRA